MTNFNAIEFKNMTDNLSLSQLRDMQEEIKNEISKMVMNTDLIQKLAILESIINERQGE